MDLKKKEPSIRFVINYFMVVLERFSCKCRKTKTKIVITLTNHKGHRQYSEPNKSRSNYAADAKRGKKRASESCFILILLLIGSKGGVMSCFSQLVAH